MIKHLKISLMKTVAFIRSTRGQSLRYLFIGGCTTLLSFAVFALMTRGLRIGDTVSNVTSVSVSILFAYVANKHVVFHSRCRCLSELALEFVKFVGSRLTTMAVEVGGVLLFTDVFGQDSLIAKAETQVIVIVGNFLISKYIVFRQRNRAA